MKVTIDISPLKSVHKTRGIGVYTRYLIKALKKIDVHNKYRLTSKISHYEADVVHYPFFDFFSRTLPFFNRGLAVVTIHDVIPLIYPKHFPVGIKGKINLKLQLLALKKVAAIITDSDNSKEDICKYLNYPANKVNVVYLAADEEFKKSNRRERERVSRKYKLPENFILYVGDINYNKNLPCFIKAFSRLKTTKNLVLVARALKNNETKESRLIFKTIKDCRVEDRIKILTNVPIDPVDDLRGIYSLAKMYVQPSLYEGFGLPVLESMAVGTLVVCANTASLPEVVGEAGIYFNPKSVNDMRKAMEKAAKLDESKKNLLINKSKEQLSNFSWEMTAKETIKVYKKILE